tara:strand:- start:60 stop:707 length:648 start_codon:yes stop_codon:yes gene_type:complete
MFFLKGLVSQIARCLINLKRFLFYFFVLLIAFCSTNTMAIEEPKFDMIFSDIPFELRSYDEFIVAETQLSGSFDSASRQGFRRVASYIFGGNKDSNGLSEKIQMTAPVTVTPNKSDWVLHFVMPKNYSLSDLPIPNDSNVTIRTVSKHLAAVIVFSGWTTESKISERTEQLKGWILANGYIAKGPIQVARYNDPFTIPWLRRNEIIIKVEKLTEQ